MKGTRKCPAVVAEPFAARRDSDPTRDRTGEEGDRATSSSSCLPTENITSGFVLSPQTRDARCHGCRGSRRAAKLICSSSQRASIWAVGRTHDPEFPPRPRSMGPPRPEPPRSSAAPGPRCATPRPDRTTLSRAFVSMDGPRMVQRLAAEMAPMSPPLGSPWERTISGARWVNRAGRDLTFVALRAAYGQDRNLPGAHREEYFSAGPGATANLLRVSPAWCATAIIAGERIAFAQHPLGCHLCARASRVR